MEGEALLAHILNCEQKYSKDKYKEQNKAFSMLLYKYIRYIQSMKKKWSDAGQYQVNQGNAGTRHFA